MNYETHRISRVFVAIGLIAVILIFTLKGFQMHMPEIVLLIPAAFVVIQLSGNPSPLLLLVVFLQRTQFTVPHLGGTLTVADILALSIPLWVALNQSLTKRRFDPGSVPKIDRWMAVFFVNIVFTMMVRGSGFALLGSRTYGGAGYVLLASHLLFFFSVVRLPISEKQFLRLPWAILWGAVFLALIQLAALFVPFMTEVVARYFHLPTIEITAELAAEREALRLTRFAAVASAAVPLILIFRCPGAIKVILLVLASGISALSGFRGAFLSFALVIVWTTTTLSQRRRQTLAVWAAVGFLLFLLSFPFGRYLPEAVQRTLSIIPFIPVDPRVAAMANETVTWRIDLWREFCLPAVGTYLWVGRGIAHDIMEFAFLDARWYQSSEFYYHMGRYHNGFFSLLLDFGLVGLVSFTVFFVASIVQGWNFARRYTIGRQDALSRFNVYLTIVLSVSVLVYFSIFGDVRETLPRMLLTVAMLRLSQRLVLARTLESAPAVNGK